MLLLPDRWSSLQSFTFRISFSGKRRIKVGCFRFGRERENELLVLFSIQALFLFSLLVCLHALII